MQREQLNVLLDCSLPLLHHLFSTTLTDACLITVNSMTQLLHASTDFSLLHFELNNSPRRKRFNVAIIYKELSSVIDNVYGKASLLQFLVLCATFTIFYLNLLIYKR